MSSNKRNTIIGLSAIAGLTAVFAAQNFVHKVPPINADKCEAIADQQRREFHKNNGYDLNKSQRAEFLHIGVMEGECVRKYRDREATYVLALN